MNSSYASKSSQAKQLANKFCPPNRRDDLCFSLHPSSMGQTHGIQQNFLHIPVSFAFSSFHSNMRTSLETQSPFLKKYCVMRIAQTCVGIFKFFIFIFIASNMDTEIWTRNSNKPPTKIKTKSTELAYAKIINVTTILKFIVDILTMYIIKNEQQSVVSIYGPLGYALF